MIPHAALKSIPRFWGPNPANYPLMILRTKPPNPAGVAYPLCSLHDLDACHHLSSTTRSPSPLRLYLTWSTAVLTWSTWSNPHVHLLVDVPMCQTPTISLRPLVPWSKSHVRLSPLLVHQHEPAWPPPLYCHRPSQCSTPAHHKLRDMLHNTTLRLWLVQILTQSLIISWQSLIINRHIWAHLNHVFTISRLISALSTLT
jgi:hypothetical protein